MELIDRKTAIDLGLTTYFTGKECKNGHVATRKVGSGVCSVCSAAYTKAWRDNGGKPSDHYNPSGKELPSLDYLNECFEYNVEDGTLYWKERPLSHFTHIGYQKTFNNRFGGKKAGHYHSRNGYLEIRFGRTLYKGHRIIYKMVNGVEPVGLLDHIDGDVSNNRAENLRLATSQENARNSNKRPRSGTSQYKGVSSAKVGKWLSHITIDDTNYDLVFSTELEAALDYDKRAKDLFGEFAKLNFPEGVV